MAGAFSGHLIDSFQPDNPFNSSIVTSGAMSFNPNMHGTPFAQQSFSFFNSPSGLNRNDSMMSEDTAHKIIALQSKLNQKLGPEYISQRPGPGGGKFTYVEGWKVINLANEIFGFNGWSSSVVSLTTDFVDCNEERKTYTVGVTAIMRVTLRDGTYHEDVGYGMLENSRQKGAALDKCKKEAVTDGLKRALRHLGNLLGNCLYDKSFTAEVTKIKVPPPKFNKEELHRRPEFEDIKPNISAMSVASNSTSSANMSRPNFSHQPHMETPTRHPIPQPQKPLSSVPPHMRTDAHMSRPNGGSNTANNNTLNDVKGKAPAFAQTTTMNTSTTSRPAPVQAPQQPPQADRRVAFAGPSAAVASKAAPPPVPIEKPAQDLDDDDDYGYGGDDDLFASVDLGRAIGEEADMGRPIESETDMGRPIDQDEGLLHAMQAARQTRNQNQANTRLPAQPVKRDPNASMSRHELIAAALMSNDTGKSETSETGLAQAPVQHPMNLPAGPGSGSASHLRQNAQLSSSTDSNTSTSSVQAQQPPRQNQNATSMVQQQHQRYMQQRQNQNINPNLNQQQSISTSNEPKQIPVASMGGFHFPPGVNPLQQNDGPSSVGAKRPAEVMMNSNYRGTRPGMGLHTSGGHQREVFGRLDIAESGDVKRLRR